MHRSMNVALETRINALEAQLLNSQQAVESRLAGLESKAMTAFTPLASSDLTAAKQDADLISKNKNSSNVPGVMVSPPALWRETEDASTNAPASAPTSALPV